MDYFCPIDVQLKNNVWEADARPGVTTRSLGDIGRSQNKVWPDNLLIRHFQFQHRNRKIALKRILLKDEIYDLPRVQNINIASLAYKENVVFCPYLSSANSIQSFPTDFHQQGIRIQLKMVNQLMKLLSFFSAVNLCHMEKKVQGETNSCSLMKTSDLS